MGISGPSAAPVAKPNGLQYYIRRYRRPFKKHHVEKVMLTVLVHKPYLGYDDATVTTTNSMVRVLEWADP